MHQRAGQIQTRPFHSESPDVVITLTELSKSRQPLLFIADIHLAQIVRELHGRWARPGFIHGVKLLSPFKSE